MELQLLGEVDNLLIGLFSLLPAFVAILLAFVTKNVYLSLGTGVYSGFVILNIYNWLGLDLFVLELNDFFLVILSFISPIVQIPILLAQTMGDIWNAGIIMQVLMIGGVIQLLTYTGGAKLLASKIASYAKTRKSSMLITWVLGLIVFFDDYANALIVGPIMRPIIDKMKISREKLAFIIDATAAPIAGIAIISTWIGYELGLIQAGLESIGITDISAFEVFFNSIPFRFYNILILAFIVLTITMKRDFGPMLKAETLVSNGKASLGLQDIEEEIEDEVKEDIDVNIWDGVIPIVALILSSLFFFYLSGFDAIVSGSDEVLKNTMINSPLSFNAIKEAFSNADSSVVLLQAALFTLTIMFVRGKIKKQFNFTEGSSVVIKGANKLLGTVFILLCAWSLGTIISSLGASEYLANAVPENFPYYLVPSLGFVLAGIIAFSTGTSYGTMGILMPLIIPLAYTVSPDMTFVTIAVSSVLTGATFGDHCSPISDTTILSSAGAGCNHIEHVRTQMPYAMLVGAVATILYIPGTILATSVSMIYISAVILILIGIIALYIILRVVGKDPQLTHISDLKQ